MQRVKNYFCQAYTFQLLIQPHTFVEIDREMFSAVILLLPLIQEGMLSVTSKSMCAEYWLTAKS